MSEPRAAAACQIRSLPPSSDVAPEEFEAYLGFLRGLADSIRELPEENLLHEFRDDGGDPDLDAEAARQAMLEVLRRRFVG